MQANDEFLRLVFENIWPWWTYAWVLVFSLLCVFTFSGHAEKSGDKSTLRFIIEAARKKLLVAWILCTLFVLSLCVHNSVETLWGRFT